MYGEIRLIINIFLKTRAFGGTMPPPHPLNFPWIWHWSNVKERNQNGYIKLYLRYSKRTSLRIYAVVYKNSWLDARGSCRVIINPENPSLQSLRYLIAGLRPFLGWSATVEDWLGKQMAGVLPPPPQPCYTDCDAPCHIGNTAISCIFDWNTYTLIWRTFYTLIVTPEKVVSNGAHLECHMKFS